MLKDSWLDLNDSQLKSKKGNFVKALSVFFKECDWKIRMIFATKKSTIYLNKTGINQNDFSPLAGHLQFCGARVDVCTKKMDWETKWLPLSEQAHKAP